MSRYLCTAAIIAAFAGASFAQSLTPEQIAAMVDEKVNGQSPYAALLNDPDPERSRAAMQIMLESGDPELVRMALEFGLLSTDPTVKRTALEAYLTTKPVLSIRFDGSGLGENRSDPANFQSRMTGQDATHTPDGQGYWRMQVGDYNAENKCFLLSNGNGCFVTVNSDGVMLQFEGWMSARTVVGDAGDLEGSATLYQVRSPVPVSVKLLD